VALLLLVPVLEELVPVLEELPILPVLLLLPVGEYGNVDGADTRYVAELCTIKLLTWLKLPLGESKFT
jgi:hypothetical protein